jgi:hypothetical protein
MAASRLHSIEAGYTGDTVSPSSTDTSAAKEQAGAGDNKSDQSRRLELRWGLDYTHFFIGFVVMMYTLVCFTALVLVCVVRYDGLRQRSTFVVRTDGSPMIHSPRTGNAEPAAELQPPVTAEGGARWRHGDCGAHKWTAAVIEHALWGIMGHFDAYGVLADLAQSGLVLKQVVESE